MTPEVLVGLIGAGGALGGALCGGLSTFAGVVYQQKRQAAQAAEERHTEMAHQAVDGIMTQVQELRKLARAQSKYAWTPTMEELVEAIRHASLRVPHEPLRDLIDAACEWRFGANTFRPGKLAKITDTAPARIELIGLELQKCLGAYLRGEDLPALWLLAAAVEDQENYYGAALSGVAPT
jgi:hypothetical protein